MPSDDDTPPAKIFRGLSADKANELLRAAKPMPLTIEERVEELERDAAALRVRIGNLEYLLRQGGEMNMLHAIYVWLIAAGWKGVPHWGWIAAVVLAGAEYTLPRIKNPRARSLGELLFNAQGLLFGRFPVIGPLFQRLALMMGTPQSSAATAKPPEPVRIPLGAILPCLLLPALFIAGCATAQKDTMMVELSLGAAVSIGYRTIDGIDKIKTDAIAAELQTNAPKAKADYAAYKPVIEKARAALNVAEDALESADKARQLALKSNSWTDYTTWLPTLASAYATIETTIADVKGLLP